MILTAGALLVIDIVHPNDWQVDETALGLLGVLLVILLAGPVAAEAAGIPAVRLGISQGGVEEARPPDLGLGCDLADLGPLPSGMHAERWVSQADVLEEAETIPIAAAA